MSSEAVLGVLQSLGSVTFYTRDYPRDPLMWCFYRDANEGRIQRTFSNIATWNEQVSFSLREPLV